MAIKAIVNNTEKEIEQIKNSDEQDIDYVYSRIGDTEVEGALPISIKSIGGNLSNYRIYGNTVNGNSVGDKTANLFNMNDYNHVTVTENDDGSFYVTNVGQWSFSCKVETGKTYFISWEELNTVQNSSWLSVAIKAGYHVSYSQPCYKTTTKNLTPNVWYKQYVVFTATDDYLSIDCINTYIRNIMLVEGSTAMNYEHYGYKIPVTITADSAETTDIYLDAPLAKSGNNADYIDYAAQRRYNADGTESSATLPEIAVAVGTNILTVNTSIQPSNIYIKDSFDYKKVFTATRVIEDGLPLNYKSIEDSDSTLKNYRIYGNTETLTRSYSGTAPLSFPITDGAVCNYRVYGQKSRNLYDGEFLQGYWAYANGIFTQSNTWVCTTKIACIGDTAYTFSFNNASRWAGFVWYDANGDYISSNNRDSGFGNGGNFTATSPSNAAYMIVDIAGYPNASSNIAPSDVTNFMLVEGSATLPYEPYGESVGDKTANLFDMNDYNPNNITLNEDGSFYIRSTIWAFSCKVETGKTYFLSWEELNTYQNGSQLSIAIRAGYHVSYSQPSYKVTLKGSPPNVWHKQYVVFTATDDYLSIDGMGTYIRNIMLVEGSTAMDYEPYGYRIPVTNNSETANIYLDEPLTKSGDNVDYVDYAEQKRHNADGTSEDVTLPALPAQSSTNSFSVGTIIQPSSVAVDVDEVVSCGDRTANILPLSRTPKTETHGDFLCEYDGLGTITLTTDKDNATTDGEFVIPLIHDFTIPVSVGAGGTGCLQMNNDTSLASAENALKFYYNNTYIDRWSFLGVNRTSSSYWDMSNKTINVISVVISNGESSRKITIRPAFVENTTVQVPFEPYGYRIPVTNNSETANIYLDEPISKSGNNADYIDYATQKHHNSDGTESSVTLPALPTFAGTNTLSVRTEIEPSNIYIKGKIKSLD